MNNKTSYPPKKADGAGGRIEVVRFDLLPSEKGHGEDDDNDDVDDDDDDDSDSVRKNRRRQEAKDLERWIAGGRGGGGEPRTGTGSGAGGTGRCRGGRLSRLNQPRMSLLGKPLNYRASRRDARYRRLQSKVYNFLERPRGFQAVSYHMLVFCMVFTCLALSVFSTIKKYEIEAGKALYVLESVVLVWFTVEFGFRLWSSGCRSRYQGWIGRLKFLRRPFCIIDVTTILASLVVIGMGSSIGSLSALRGLRFFQILRMVRMDRRGGTWKLLGSVVYAHRQELITTLYIGFLGLIFASFLVYLAEKEANAEKFSNFADALWWGVITLCTVGYGDAVPITWQGKVIASFCALLGISFFALPAGILGSGFALKVQQQQRQKHMIRRRQPAATLIQSLWRCYAADEQSMSIATWRIHQVPLPSPPGSSRNSSSFKHNASFVSRLPTIRRHKSSSIHSGQLTKGATPRTDMNASVENLGITSPRHLNASHSEDSVTDTFSNKNKNSDDSRFIFEAHPSNEVRLNTTNSTLRRMGEATQLPLVLCGLLQQQQLQQHQLLLHQQQQLEQQQQMPLDSPKVPRRGVETSFSLFSRRSKPDNDDDEPRCLHLTSQHKGAIRAIRKLKYFVARKKFREALKPYDVKDVIEQYSSGHADLLNRVRSLQCRLDQILGKQGSKSKDVYASKISLASRVVKVERQVDDIEMKLDQLMDLYMEDRKRLLSLPLPPEDPSLAGLGGASGSAGIYLRPRPILVDKHSSEPNTPISKSSHRPIMHRGNSDVSHRIKKRVTLSSIPSQYVMSASPSPGYRDVESGAPFRRLDDVVIVVPSIDSSPDDGDEMDNFNSSPTAIAMTSGDEADDVDDADDGEECDEGEEGVDDDDCWHDSESATLLRARAVNTEITVTPTTPSTSATDLTKEEETVTVFPMDSLSPTTTPYRRDN